VNGSVDLLGSPAFATLDACGLRSSTLVAVVLPRLICTSTGGVSLQSAFSRIFLFRPTNAVSVVQRSLTSDATGDDAFPHMYPCHSHQSGNFDLTKPCKFMLRSLSL